MDANRFFQRSQELKALITDRKLDIMLISDRHFTKRNYMKIPGFTIMTPNILMVQAHGGSAVLLCNSIKHYLLSIYKSAKLQATNAVI